MLVIRHTILRIISNNIRCCNSSKSIVTIVVSHHNYHNYIIIRNTSNITVGINIMAIMTLMYTLERALKRLGVRVELNLLLIDQLCTCAVHLKDEKFRRKYNDAYYQWLHPCSLMKPVGAFPFRKIRRFPILHSRKWAFARRISTYQQIAKTNAPAES